MQGGHFFCYTKKSEDIRSGLWHYSDFKKNIRSQILHFAEPGNQLFTGRSSFEIMIGCNDFYAMSMSRLNDIFYGIIARKNFHIDKIYKAGFSNIF